MESQLAEARSYLEKAENELRGIIISAVNGGSYDVVTRLTELSAKLRQLVESLPEHSAETRERAPSTTPAFHGEQLVPADDARQRRASQSSVEKERKVTRTQKGPDAAYPRFFVREDQLVKLGWSSSSNKEYEHRVPRAGLDAFIEYLGTLRRSRFPVTAEAIAKGIQKVDPQQILGYQVYVVAAWLKSLDLLRSEGRQGYCIPDGMDWADAVAAAWKTLVQKSGHS